MLAQKWFVYALLAALSAALVGIFGKVGMERVDSNLATAVRSMVMTLFLVGFATFIGSWRQVGSIDARAMSWIALSGLAGAISWLFGFKAIQLSSVSQVASIDKLSMPLAVILAVLILRERPTGVNWLGISLIVLGAYLAALPKPG